MSGKLCVLLDANIIIIAHELGVWNHMVSRLTLVIPDAVAREAEFYDDRITDDRVFIHLDATAQQGLIQIVATSLEALDTVRGRLDDIVLERIDPGEAEALALLFNGDVRDHLFCTGDGPAIRALSLLDLRDAGISLERLLKNIGYTHSMPEHYSQKWFEQQLDAGARDRIQGVGLRQSKSASKKKARKPRTSRR